MFWHKMYNNKMRKEVTIMSVYYSSETRMLQELNKALTDRLNPGNNHTWLFAENSKEKIKINPVQFPDVNTKVFPGVAGWREDVISFLRGSFNHAGGLQTLLPYVETRFVVCTEPDFFIIRPKWISEMINAMKAKKISFFGAPYDPRRYNMYRYFPHVAFMAMDLSRVDKSTLDFNPIHSSSDIFHRIKKKILGKRANINTRRDTSSKIFERYHKTHASECIQPVFSGKIWFFEKDFQNSDCRTLGIYIIGRNTFIGENLTRFICKARKKKRIWRARARRSKNSSKKLFLISSSKYRPVAPFYALNSFRKFISKPVFQKFN